MSLNKLVAKNVRYIRILLSITQEELANEMNVNQSFIEGAKWAEQHPSVDTVKKIICYALKYTNIMLADDLENGVEWELLIKKAMEE